MKKVEIYTTQTCPFCHAAKRLLTKKNIDFIEIKVDHDPALRRIMTDRAKGSRTVPQIFVDNHHIGGCDDLYALESKAKLDKLLGH